MTSTIDVSYELRHHPHTHLLIGCYFRNFSAVQGPRTRLDPKKGAQRAQKIDDEMKQFRDYENKWQVFLPKMTTLSQPVPPSTKGFSKVVRDLINDATAKGKKEVEEVKRRAEPYGATPSGT